VEIFIFCRELACLVERKTLGIPFRTILWKIKKLGLPIRTIQRKEKAGSFVSNLSWKRKMLEIPFQTIHGMPETARDQHQQ
jgi:hypothetical protein